ncbi:MAG TPA: hypothetical protein VGX28_06070 [Frankiaceae bacterium]|jgi:hypothetical protein|nr:hypothetical protein [Frankiaceae bacterium]
MNDLSSLRGPRLAPPTGALDRALATGRARLRRRRIARAAATTSCVAFVAVAVLGSGGGTQSLDQTDPAAPGVHTTPGGATPAPGATVRSPAGDPGAPGVIPSGLPLPLPSRTHAGPSATAAPPAAPPDGSRRFVGIGSRDVAITHKNDPAACVGQPSQWQWIPDTGYCTSMTGPASVTVGQPATYAYTLCRAPGQDPATLTFTTEQEALYHAYDLENDGADGGGPHWRLGWPDPDGPRHTVTFEPGDCRTWRAQWMGQDDEGYAFPDGQYEMFGFPAAEELIATEGTDRMPVPSTVMVTVSS